MENGTHSHGSLGPKLQCGLYNPLKTQPIAFPEIQAIVPLVIHLKTHASPHPHPLPRSAVSPGPTGPTYEVQACWRAFCALCTTCISFDLGQASMYGNQLILKERSKCPWPSSFDSGDRRWPWSLQSIQTPSYMLVLNQLLKSSLGARSQGLGIR